jgi:hypothetical protein
VQDPSLSYDPLTFYPRRGPVFSRDRSKASTSCKSSMKAVAP